MLDEPNERAVIGDNLPPAYDQAVVDELKTTVDAFLEATTVWLNAPPIDNEADAGAVTDQITGLRGLFKKVDAARKEQKKPHDDAGTAVQAAFAKLLDPLEKAATRLKPKLAEYVEKKAQREAAEKAEAEARARRAAEEAEAELRAAEEANDLAAVSAAEEKAKAAEKAEKAAARPVGTSVKSGTGAGRTMAMRKVKEVEIGNPRVLALHYIGHPALLDVLRRLATADVRAKGYDHDAAPIPGITITEKTTVA